MQRLLHLCYRCWMKEILDKWTFCAMVTVSEGTVNAAATVYVGKDDSFEYIPRSQIHRTCNVGC